MENRLEVLRHEVDKLIYEKQPDKSRYCIGHLYGVARFCVLLALKRNLNPELAATSGMLHDIYQVTAGTTENHAVKGAQVATELLKALKSYTDDEISIITTAISRHSKKRAVHEPYDELLKDADVLDHCLYNPGFEVIDKEVERYNNLLVELGCSPSL
jgi:HD superfamily phosphodiesterase